MACHHQKEGRGGPLKSKYALWIPKSTLLQHQQYFTSSSDHHLMIMEGAREIDSR